MIPMAWQRMAPMHMLISAHRDGRIIADAVAYFGIEAIAGSTRRGGSAALRNDAETAEGRGLRRDHAGRAARPGDERQHRHRQCRAAGAGADRADHLCHQPAAHARQLGPVSCRAAVRPRRVSVGRADRDRRRARRGRARTRPPARRAAHDRDGRARPTAASGIRSRCRRPPSRCRRPSRECGRRRVPIVFGTDVAEPAPPRDAAACLSRADPAAAAAGRCSTCSGGGGAARRTAGGCASAAGFACGARPPGPLVWIHAASVGEATAMLRLIERLLETRPDARNPGHHRHRRLGPAARKAAAGAGAPPIRAGRPARLDRALSRSLAAGSGALGRIRTVAQPGAGDACPRHSDDAGQWPAVGALVSALAALARADRPDARRLRAVPGAGCRAGRAAPPARRPRCRRDRRSQGCRRHRCRSTRRNCGGCAGRSARARCGSPPAPMTARRRSPPRSIAGSRRRASRLVDDHRAAPSGARRRRRRDARRARAARRPAQPRRADRRRNRNLSRRHDRRTRPVLPSRRDRLYRRLDDARRAGTTRSRRPGSTAPSCTGRI